MWYNVPEQWREMLSSNLGIKNPRWVNSVVPFTREMDVINHIKTILGKRGQDLPQGLEARARELIAQKHAE